MKVQSKDAKSLRRSEAATAIPFQTESIEESWSFYMDTGDHSRIWVDEVQLGRSECVAPPGLKISN